MAYPIAPSARKRTYLPAETPRAQKEQGAEAVNKHITLRWTLICLSLLMLASGIIMGETNPFPEEQRVHDPLSLEEANDPFSGGQPVSPTLLSAVGAAHRKIVGNGSAAFGPSCLKLFPRAFKRGEELAKVPSALLAGIAGYESAGCSKAKNGRGNIMHITLADDEHIVKAASLLGIPKGVLNWRRYSEHSVVLGAVMLQNYYERTGSVEAALAAYRHGPSSDKEGERYANLVLAHGVLALRHQWNEATEAPVHNANPVEEIDIRSLVLQMHLSPALEAKSLVAMQE